MLSRGIINLGPARDGGWGLSKLSKPVIKQPRYYISRTTLALLSLLVLCCLSLPSTPYDVEHQEPGGVAWYTWERFVYDDSPGYQWHRVPFVFYSLASCVAWSVRIMLQDESEVFVCKPNGSKPDDPGV